MKTVFPHQYILELPTFEYGCLGGGSEYQGRDEEEVGATDEQPLTGSSNLKAQQKVLCYRDERKICYILYSNVKSKKESKFLHIHSGRE